MNRRRFLQVTGGLGLSAALPAAAVAGGNVMARAAAAVPGHLSANGLKWAETLVRAHRSCTTGMLQRHMGLDAPAAEALKARLVDHGIITAEANRFGAHQALRPLSNTAFPQTNNGRGLRVSRNTKTTTGARRPTATDRVGPAGFALSEGLTQTLVAV